MSSNPVLTFNTPEPQAVAIGGVAYPLRSRNDLSLAQGVRYERLMRAALPLIEKARSDMDLTDTEDRQLSDLIRQLGHLAIEAPREVIDGLKDGPLWRIVGVAFFEVSPVRLAPETVPTEPPQTARKRRTKTTRSSRR